MTQSLPQLLHVLGDSDLNLSRIGLGCWALGGGDWEHSLGPQDDKESIAAIHYAIDHGINWIDTAPAYGLGHSETVVGRAIKTASNRPYIFTKCGIRWRQDRSLYNSLKTQSVVEELEASLQRLQVETIDLYQVHWPLPDEEVEECWETLSRLRGQGKVRWIGVSNFSTPQMERALKIAPITSIQSPYSLLRRGSEAKILPFAQAKGIGVINYSPMASGLLTGGMTAETIAAFTADDSRRRNVQFQEPRLSLNLRLVESLRKIANQHNVSPGVVATAWTLHHPAIIGAIVGARTKSEVEGLILALDFRLSEDEYDEISGLVKSLQWILGRIYCRLAPRSWFKN